MVFAKGQLSLRFFSVFTRKTYLSSSRSLAVAALLLISMLDALDFIFLTTLSLNILSGDTFSKSLTLGFGLWEIVIPKTDHPLELPQ